MEKNTILAVVLSTVVLIVFFVIQGIFYPPPEPQPVQSQSHVTATSPAQETETPPVQIEEPAVQEEEPVLSQENIEAETNLKTVTIKTDLLSVVLTNAGGNIVSWKLNNHLDKDENVDMIFSGTNEAKAFSIAFGGLDAPPETALFYVKSQSDLFVEFERDFVNSAGERFTLTKRYDFAPSEYMFKLTITLDGGYSGRGFNFGGNAYTLSFGPQIGPKFEKLDARNDYRQYSAYFNGKRRNARVNDTIEQPEWAAISGKYFALIAKPNIPQFSSISFSEIAEPGVPSASRLNIVRTAVSSRDVKDEYYFYLGPKSQDSLTIYHNGRNSFGFMNSNIIEVASSRGILSPLERLLKWLLLIFYRIAPNYGIAIILLTLFIKIAFFPLTKKGSEATLRMQALSPKIKELQEKHKGNPQKLNAEMAAFYQKEGYNPVSGCLPMLLQIPIFIAMYNLFNNHFDLRGAMFIPGWIPDLSVPESIWDFPDGFTLPILGWTALRALPFIYVGSQLIYGKVTQAPGQQSNSQMKMMMYAMPIMFFFILYNVPSGLLIYWIFSNILTLAQQLIINKYNKAKKPVVEEPQPVIAPKKKKKN